MRIYAAGSEESLRARKLLKDWAGEGFLAQPLPDISISGLGGNPQDREYLLGILESEFTNDLVIIAGSDGGDLRVTGGVVRFLLDPVSSRIRPDTGPYSMGKGDIIYSGVDGVARCQEWWHFQYQDLVTPPSGRQKWADLLEQIGYSKEGLLKLGYPPSDMDKSAY